MSLERPPLTLAGSKTNTTIFSHLILARDRLGLYDKVFFPASLAILPQKTPVPPIMLLVCATPALFRVMESTSWLNYLQSATSPVTAALEGYHRHPPVP